MERDTTSEWPGTRPPLKRHPRWPVDVLMLVTDRHHTGGRPLPEVVDAAIEGGVNVVQLREKDLPARDLLALTRQLRGICGHRALLIINDRVDVALLSGADGVHLPENGLPCAPVRHLLPASMVVGRSVHSIQAARQAETDGANYVLVGTLFPSPSHPEGEPAGLDLLKGVTSRLVIPTLGIGGVNCHNAAECRRWGAAGVAAASHLLRAPDVRLAAEELASPPPVD
jgi:thiamine-phosphate pyrophosphorylase